MPPQPIARLLESNALWIACRVLMTFMFWWEALQFLRNFSASIPVLNLFGMQPAWIFPVIVLAVLLCGSALVLLDRYLWLGAGMLAAFTLLAIVFVHHFWTMSGMERMLNWQSAEEHVATIGGLAALSIISHQRQASRGQG